MPLSAPKYTYMTQCEHDIYLRSGKKTNVILDFR